MVEGTLLSFFHDSLIRKVLLFSFYRWRNWCYVTCLGHTVSGRASQVTNLCCLDTVRPYRTSLAHVLHGFTSISCWLYPQNTSRSWSCLTARTLAHLFITHLSDCDNFLFAPCAMCSQHSSHLEPTLLVPFPSHLGESWPTEFCSAPHFWLRPPAPSLFLNPTALLTPPSAHPLYSPFFQLEFSSKCPHGLLPHVLRSLLKHPFRDAFPDHAV